MKFFVSSPTETLYFPIQNHSLEIGEKDLAHIFERVRFDPRLMEVATEFIRDFWWNLAPETLNHQMKLSKYPFAIKPAILAILRNCHFANPQLQQSFGDWANLVLRGIRDPAPQLFYIGLNKIGSKSMQREENEALACFTQHNLIAKDLPFNKGIPGFVKTKEDQTAKLNFSDSLKSEFALKIRKFKVSGDYTNAQMTDILKINRTFLSKILNNKLTGISLDYLAEKAQLADGKS